MELQLSYIGGGRANLGYTVDKPARPQLCQGKGFAAALPHYTEHAHPSRQC